MKRTKDLGVFSMISPYAFVGIRPKDLPKQLRVRLNYVKYKYSVEIILDAVSKVMNVKPEKISQKDRHRNIAEARKMYCFFVKQKMNLPLKTIADTIGRDHTTVIHNIAVFKDLYECDEFFRSKADEISEIIEDNSIDVL